jgi:hypothetical protein
MSNPSPLVTVQDGGGTVYVAANGAATVTAANVITIALISTAGVATWGLALVGQDELVAPPTVTVNQTTKTATFTAPAGPWSLRYQSQVNGGVDINGVAQPSYTTTFKIVVAQTGGAHLLATNEVAEDSPTFGWIGCVNAPIRTATPKILAGATTVLQLAAASSDFVSFGAQPAQAGFVRASNNTSIVTARNGSNTNDLVLVSTDSGNTGIFGAFTSSTKILTNAGARIVLNAVGSNSDTLTLGTSPSTATAFIQVSSGQTIISGRNNANSANVPVLSTDASDNVIIGGTNGAGVKLSVGAVTPFSTTATVGSWSFTAATAPGTPSAGTFVFYIDSADSKLKYKGSSGTVTIVAVP